MGHSDINEDAPKEKVCVINIFRLRNLGLAIRRIFGSDADSDSLKNPLKKTRIFHGFRILGILADCGFSDSDCGFSDSDC